MNKSNRKFPLVKEPSKRKKAKKYKRVNPKIRSERKVEVKHLILNKPEKKLTEDDLTGMMKIRYLLGKIFETVQYLEYNLSLLLRYSMIYREMKKNSTSLNEIKIKSISSRVDKQLKDAKVDFQTFGNLISTLSENNVLEKKDLDELEDLLQTRNTLAHQYFKKNKFEEQENNKAFLDGQSNYLLHIQNRVKNLNDRICSQLNFLAMQIVKIK